SKMPLSTSTKKNFIRVGNVLSLLLLFVANAVSLNWHPSLIDIYYKHLTYLSPSLIFVGIFVLVLYVLLFGFVFYVQFSNAFIIQRVVTSTVGCLLIVSNLLICGWLFSLTSEEFYLSELFMFLALLVTLRFHHNIV
ncbi:4949_t:CDS:2, partial [Acaulospora morrowiae]